MPRSLSPIKLAGAVGIALVLAGLAALIVSVAPVSSPSADQPQAEPTSSPGAYTGDEAVDEIIRSVLRDGGADLEVRFAGVTARAGALLGGPIGLYQPKDVPAREWTSLLGSAERSLHAVVKDPREPFEWWDQPPLDIPRAAVLTAPRDFDIVLIVGSSDAIPRAWRFSVSGGLVIDVVIDRGEGPGHDEPVALVRRLGYLTPSPDDEPESFLVLPPHEMRPPPAGIGFSFGRAKPAPVQSPTLAPDGRTGDAVLDALIDQLLKPDTATLIGTYKDLPAAQQVCDPSCEDIRISPADWTSRLSAGGRSLYAVFTGDPAEAEVMLLVDSGRQAAEAWRFRVLGGALAQVEIFLPPPSAGGPGYPFYAEASGHAPSPIHEYERFYVLPPADALPPTPRVHAPSARTGDAGVDEVLGALEARDAKALLVSFGPAPVPFRECRGPEEQKDAAFAAQWSEKTVKEFYGVHSVVRPPAGYQPAADHVILTFRQLKPYWWEALGILEKQGDIVGVIYGDWGCTPEAVYPTGQYVVPPPEGGMAGLDPARRSGIALVDAILDAAQAKDTTAMDRVIDYTREACGDPSGAPPGAGPPECPPGAAAGTAVELLPWVVCHGGRATRERAPAELIETLAFDERSGLYAVIEARAGLRGGPPTPDSGRVVLIGGQRGAGVALSLSERGVTSVWQGCGPAHPETLIYDNAAPSFLLPPP